MNEWSLALVKMKERRKKGGGRRRRRENVGREGGGGGVACIGSDEGATSMIGRPTIIMQHHRHRRC